MSTIHETILAMLATIRDLRNTIRKGKERINKNEPDPLVMAILEHPQITQKELSVVSSNMSTRTMRRRLKVLIDEGTVVLKKHGREVLYSLRDNYPQ